MILTRPPDLLGGALFVLVTSAMSLACSASQDLGSCEAVGAATDAGADTRGAAPDKSVTMTGSISGVSFEPRDVTAIVTATSLLVVITDYAGVCDIARARVQKANAASAYLEIDGQSGVGVHLVGAAGASNVGGTIQVTDPDCMVRPTRNDPESGRIEITELTDALVAGRFELTFGAESLRGEFRAPRCAATEDPRGGLLVCRP